MLALLLALFVLPPFAPFALPVAAVGMAHLAALPATSPAPADCSGGLPLLLTPGDRDPSRFDGRRVAVRGRLRMVGAGRDRHYVVTTADGKDVHLELPRSEFGKLEALQGRPGECRGTLECRAHAYPNPAYDRTDLHLHPDEILPILPPAVLH